MTITAARLRELFNYDPETGIFTHRVGRKGGGTRAGDVAGRIRPHDGRRRIGVDYGRFFAYQLAWLYVTGEWPNSTIDHKNGIQSDDRFSNLRLCTNSENMANARRPSRNTSGFKGVSWHAARGKWRATIKKDRVSIHIGHFDSPIEAHEAYIAKANELFGAFARAA